MIAELGHFAMIASLAMAVLLSVLPLWGANNNNGLLMNTSRPLSWGMFILLAISFYILCYSFYVNDFTLTYVANNSNTALLGTTVLQQFGVRMKARYFFGY